MGHPHGQQPHTLAQFARRAGISEGRARALHNQTPSPLPTADTTDADGRPLWFAATIDAWCANTGREVTGDSLWIFRASAAMSAPVELRRGPVRLSRFARPLLFYAIVWDTEHGHVIYLQPLESKGDHRDWLAVHAAELIEPRWWSQAVVVMNPLDVSLGSGDPEYAHIYRLITKNTGGQADEPGAVREVAPLGDRLRRFLGKVAATVAPNSEFGLEFAGEPASEPRAEWEGQLKLASLASTLGTRIPVWVSGTATPDNADRSLAYDRTFIVEDHTSDWPATQIRLEQAVRCGMPADYPSGFAALAVDAAGTLDYIRDQHATLPDSGPGWYLVCRPAQPAPPVELERHLTGVDLVGDLDLVEKELVELREVEGELDVDDERGEPYAGAATLLYWQLRRAALMNGTIRSLDGDYLPVADDDFIVYSAPWSGPVVEAWQHNLRPLDNVETQAALRTRRVRRLLAHDSLEPDDVKEINRDEHGRYVLVVALHSGVWSLAEWPKSLAVVDTWTDKTVLAADGGSGAVTLLALTPAEDGRMRTDPVPMPLRSWRDAFAYGYGGSTPGTTHTALLRCVLGETPAFAQAGKNVCRPESQLWQAISTTQGPLRLSWPQVQLWAQADQRAGEHAPK